MTKTTTDIIREYHLSKMKGRTIVKMRDFYNIYCLLEEYNNRTPLTDYNWRAGLYSYFNQIWKFMIRTTFNFKIMHCLGTIMVKPTENKTVLHRFKHRKFKVVWRKYQTVNKVKNQELYNFKPFYGNVNRGMAALDAWVRETGNAKDLKWYNTF